MVPQSDFSEVYSWRMDSIFTKILKREIPAEIIYEDQYSFVIPDRFPSMPGQLLVITKRQAPYLFELEEREYQALMQTTKLLAQVLDTVSGKSRTCVAIEGFEVPHVHVRLYPCNEPGLILHPKSEASPESLKKLAEAVRTELAQIKNELR